MDTTKIASFDPASQKNIGWAVVNLSSNGIQSCIADTFVMPTFDNRWQVYWPMFQVVDDFLGKNKPDLVVIEKTSSFMGGFVSGQVSQCMGTIFAACSKYNINVEFAFPTSVKKIVAGHGKATKTQIKKAVATFILNTIGEKVNFSSEHAYDAVSNILFYLIKNEKIEPLKDYPWLSAKQLKTLEKGKKKNAQK